MESQYRCIRTLAHKANSLTFSSDGKTLVSFNNDDKTANVWDVNTGELKKTFTGFISIALSLDGTTLASSKNDNTIKLLDVKTGELKNSLTGHSSVITFIAFSSDGKTLVSEGKETIKLWNIMTGELRSTIAKGTKCFCSSVLSPNGQTLAIFNRGVQNGGTSGRSVTLWDVETGQLIRTFNEDLGYDYSGSIAFSHDGKTLFISFTKTETAYIYSPDGGRDDYEERYNYTLLWDLTTGQIRKTFRSNLFEALSPDGSSSSVNRQSITVVAATEA